MTHNDNNSASMDSSWEEAVNIVFTDCADMDKDEIMELYSHRDDCFKSMLEGVCLNKIWGYDTEEKYREKVNRTLRSVADELNLNY